MLEETFVTFAKPHLETGGILDFVHWDQISRDRIGLETCGQRPTNPSRLGPGTLGRFGNTHPALDKPRRKFGMFGPIRLNNEQPLDNLGV